MTRRKAEPLFDPILACLDECLQRNCDSPLVVGFSGGADSLLLLSVAKSWADGAGRRIIAATVDHRLQAGGAAWAIWCRDRARRMGVEHRILAWTGRKPSTGIPAAARAARHALIAELARRAGAAVVLMGHTADDGFEARLMRAWGGSLSESRAWSPSPAWPEGRGVFILRPLISARRADIRATLAAQGETWIDDPFNGDMRFARSHARRALEAGQVAHDDLAPKLVLPCATSLMGAVVEDDSGALCIPREVLSAQGPGIARHVVGAALLCAAGEVRPPRNARLGRLLARLTGAEDVIATLAGARAEADDTEVRLMREPGEMFRHCGMGAAMVLPRGRAVVWDGRFEIKALTTGLEVRPLDGLVSRLAPADRKNLQRFVPAARRALPVVVDHTGRVSCPILRPDPAVVVRKLVFARLAATCGLLNDEMTVKRMAEMPMRP